MTQVHFTLNQEDIQKLIEESVTDDLSKNLLTTVFNQLMEEQRNQYVGVGDYEEMMIASVIVMATMKGTTLPVLELYIYAFQELGMVSFLLISLKVTSVMKKPF